jgi:hypothetical protein
MKNEKQNKANYRFIYLRPIYLKKNLKKLKQNTKIKNSI